MTIYLLLAFALGAISAVGEAPVVRPAAASVARASAARRETRLRRRVIRTFAAARSVTHPLFAVASAPRAISPMSGAATTRAPGSAR